VGPARLCPFDRAKPPLSDRGHAACRRPPDSPRFITMRVGRASLSHFVSSCAALLTHLSPLLCPLSLLVVAGHHHLSSLMSKPGKRPASMTSSSSSSSSFKPTAIEAGRRILPHDSPSTALLRRPSAELANSPASLRHLVPL
jgi:hypothetical protein